MDPATAAQIAGVAGSLVNAGLQKRANDKNIALSREQMNFQREMSSTAHQREVEDLKKAGLNPILSAGGGGASTPSGASPQVTAPQISLPDFMAYGISIKQLEQADQRLALDKQNSAAQIAKSLSETDLNKMKKILLNKGMIRAELEGEASSVMRNIIQFMKNSVKTPKQPGQSIPERADRAYQQYLNSERVKFRKP